MSSVAMTAPARSPTPGISPRMPSRPMPKREPSGIARSIRYASRSIQCSASMRGSLLRADGVARAVLKAVVFGIGIVRLVMGVVFTFQLLAAFLRRHFGVAALYLVDPQLIGRIEVAPAGVAVKLVRARTGW